MKYTLLFLLNQFVSLLVSPITAKRKCVFYIESMLPVLVQDISGCNHATGSIMKYTLPFFAVYIYETSSY